ncbi:HAD hydrolase-like protein, partial [Candidatus Saccharibacteria bacterium]|nr:HAD hydrolase-like protein [Candidatus Saccharibacteria bacterium]
MAQFNHVWLLDFDRTISSVDVVSRMVTHVCDDMGLDYSLLEREHARTEARGESFVVTKLFKQLWPQFYAEFQERLHQVDHLESVFPDAAAFIDGLGKRGERFVIITFGDREWQMMKLRFSGLADRPYIVCASPHKSDLIRSWQHGTMFKLSLD